jgi:hypothetical protein
VDGLKINKDKLECVDIVYPTNCPDVSAQDLAYCEGFISRLLSVSKREIKIKFNTSLRLVETNVAELKQYLDIVLKANKLNNLYGQFNKLFFNQRTLKLIKQDKLYEINIQEQGTFPDFTWIITKPA